MTTTVRLDDEHECYIKRLTELLHKGKSELIRDAIKFYAESRLNEEKNTFAKAVKKTRSKDADIASEFDGASSDGL